MADTTYTPPKSPKIIKPHKSSEFQNTDSNWFRLTCFFAGISGSCVWEIINRPMPTEYQLALGAISVISGGLWAKYCGLDPRKADKSWIKFEFKIDEIFHRHIMNKLTTPVEKLSKSIPFKKIHKNGLVECTGNEYIILVDLNPPRGSDDKRAEQTALVKAMIDGLHDNMIFKIIASSKVNPRKAIIEYLMKIANKTGSKERSEHLVGILKKVLSDQTPVMMYRHYAMVGLGKHETVESAEIARGALLDGILINMKRAHLKPKPLLNKKQIINLFRESLSERVML